MSTPVHTFNIDNQTQFSSAVALSGIPITSTPPIDGQALVFNAAVNQFQYATISTPVGFVDIASAQTITGVKTIATDLQFSAGAAITQSGNTFTLPTASGALATTPTGGAFVDTTSAQTITGVKTIATDLQFSAGAVITQSGNTFTLPTASGALATTPTGGAFVDTTSAQTISGVKTIGTDLQFSAGAVITTGSNNTATGSASLAAVTTGSALTATGTNSFAANTTGTTNVA